MRFVSKLLFFLTLLWSATGFSFDVNNHDRFIFNYLEKSIGGLTCHQYFIPNFLPEPETVYECSLDETLNAEAIYNSLNVEKEYESSYCIHMDQPTAIKKEADCFLLPTHPTEERIYEEVEYVKEISGLTCRKKIITANGEMNTSYNCSSGEKKKIGNQEELAKELYEALNVNEKFIMEDCPASTVSTPFRYIFCYRHPKSN